MSLLSTFSSLLKSAPRAHPADYRGKIHSGEAVLVDVREPAEWDHGVAESAVLLPLSDLRRDRSKWASFLAQAGSRVLLLYCASGTRSGIAARLLCSEGIRAINAGGLADWSTAGWPIAAPSRFVKSQNKGKK